MDTEELNNYFKHYLLEDKTNSAIMLSAPWGTGKSHYIKTELIPFLQKNKLGYAMISLYGINDLAGISKSLYLELRLNKALEKAKSRKKIYQNRLSKWFSKHGREV
ncbi:MAG: hypothetical protein K2I67_02060, partial [Malacoplasma sp.]|nr:hypothetical protein [Malacoplasma sp.]